VDGHRVEFNLSHAGDFTLIAIAQECRVGVDVERIRSGISSHVIAQQYFSASEFAELQSFPLKQRETAFFTCWTRKEAYIKALGEGLSIPLDSFDVSLEPGKPADLLIVSMRSARQTPMYDPLSHLVYVTRGDDVQTVVVNGKILMKNRKVLTLDEAAALAEANAWAAKVTASVRVRKVH